MNTTATNRMTRWQLRDDAEQLGRLLARSGVSRQSCVLKDPDIQDALLRGWQAEIALMGIELDRIPEAEQINEQADQDRPAGPNLLERWAIAFRNWLFKENNDA